MKKLLFITSNPKKINEVKAILGNDYEIQSLEDIEWTEEIPEPFDTIEENAIHKANYFFEKTGLTCFSEDSGLEVDALNGKPGAYSARYAGEPKSDQKNYEKLLSELQGVENRNARFKSVFCYVDSQGYTSFEGTMEGKIGLEARGTNGFGYDPIFIPNGFSITNAELTPEEKNAISHRQKSLMKLIQFLQK